MSHPMLGEMEARYKHVNAYLSCYFNLHFSSADQGSVPESRKFGNDEATNKHVNVYLSCYYNLQCLIPADQGSAPESKIRKTARLHINMSMCT